MTRVAGPFVGAVAAQNAGADADGRRFPRRAASVRRREIGRRPRHTGRFTQTGALVAAVRERIFNFGQNSAARTGRRTADAAAFFRINIRRRG